LISESPRNGHENRNGFDEKLGKVFAKHFIALFYFEKVLQSISSRCFTLKKFCKAFHRVVLL